MRGCITVRILDAAADGADLEVNDPQAPALTTGVAFYEILAAKHPNVRLQIVNKAGRFNFREDPDEFNHTVMAFIEYWNRPAEGTR